MTIEGEMVRMTIEGGVVTMEDRPGYYARVVLYGEGRTIPMMRGPFDTEPEARHALAGAMKNAEAFTAKLGYVAVSAADA